MTVHAFPVKTDLSYRVRRLDAILTSISDGVVVTNMDGSICFINQMALNITGWCEQKVLAMNLGDLLQLTAIDDCGMRLDTNRIAAGESVSNLRQNLKTASGTELPIEVSTNLITDDDEALIVFTFRDISKQIRYEKRILRSAYYDDLTNLPNRTLFIDRLESAINRRKREAKDHFAVVLLGLDGFSSINEKMGHEAGDGILNEIATRIAITLRPDDTVARLNGDVFAVLLEHVDSATGVIQACDRLQQVIEEPIELKSHTQKVTTSIGILFNPDVYEKAEEMLRDANTALARAKSVNAGSYVIFDSDMHKNVLQFLNRKSSMEQALEDGIFEVHYQPIIDVATEKLVSMEALVRWPHPEEGYISPTEFIPIAERTGLILSLGEFVLRDVCEQIETWGSSGFDGFRVAVNLSARQFENNVPKMVRNIIKETGISPTSLALEITEGIAMKNVDKNIRMLEELRNLGLSISIDDFGTGYSSLAYLKRFPLNTLKIDQSFIRDITTSEDDREITRAIIALGQNLRLKVLAEGVETTEQVDILRSNGCDYIQGYFYGRPLPAKEVVPFLRAQCLLKT